jgi:hypothetical protein
VIRQLRAKSEANKKSARKALDIIVLIATAMCVVMPSITNDRSLRALVRYSQSEAPWPLVLVTGAQTLLLLLSLTPDSIPVPSIQAVAEKWHQVILGAQVALFFVIFLGFRDQSHTVIDFLRWALPELVAGAVEIQRGSERDSTKSFKDLEKVKYELKGA